MTFDLDRPGPHDVLVIIDPQIDFCPGGRLAVPHGDAIMASVNHLAARFAHTVITQDWHPPGHASFASTHGEEPFSTKTLPYGEQVLWPDHCVQGSDGAEFHPLIQSGAAIRAELILRKGHHLAVDSYSAFFENDRTTPTGLGGYLRERGFQRCVFVGLALDFCVRYSAEDALMLGFQTAVVTAGVRAIDINAGVSALEALAARGACIEDRSLL